MKHLESKIDSVEQYPFLSGGGEMGTLIRSRDWSATSLGAPDSWPQCLRTTLNIILNSKFPMFLWWGPDLICFYNDAYRPSLGQNGKHPGILGIRASEAWAEIWDIIKPLIDQVLAGGVSTWSEDQLIPIFRNGKIENVYWTFSYSPVNDESGNTNGVLVICTETTGKVNILNEIKESKDQLEKSERRFRNIVKQAPLGISIMRGPQHIVEMANESYLQIIDKKENEFIGKPLFESLPEVEETIAPLLTEVLNTGEPFYGTEFPITINRNGQQELTYFNFVYHPLREEDDSISGIIVVASEITSLVKAKHTLAESEKQFRNLVMQSPTPMAIFMGENHVIELANIQMIQKIWRKKESEVLGKRILDVFPELKTQKYPQLLREVYTSGKAHREDESVAYIEGNDGMKKFYLDFEYAPLFEREGTISGIIITVNDVTEKVEARHNAEDAGERLRLAVEATELATWDLDLQTEQLISSPRLAEIFGHNKTDEITFGSLRKQVHPDDIHDVVEKSFEKALRTGLYKYEARILKPGNKICWIRTQGKLVFDKEKKPVKLIGTLRDITEEKQHEQELLESEQKFRLLADSMPQHIWTADTEGHLNYFNKSVFEFSGLTAEQLDKDGWTEIVHPDDREENIKAWMNSVTTGKDFLFEHRFRRYDGEYRWQLSRAIPQRDARGNIQMWVGTSTDVQQLKEMDQQKDLFISIASHELKTPITSIKGYAQVLQLMYKNSEDAVLTKSLDSIDKQVEKLTHLISDLLNLSKIKSGKFLLNKEHFQMNGLIEDVIDEIRHINPEYNIILSQLAATMICADRERISQVLINFLSNAIKYSPNSKEIKINSVIENNNIVVSVEDCGIGINKNDQQKIFERFYRVEGKSEKTFPGFGIGLFISSEIIHRHNGEIGIKSEPGKGSIFYFSLPLES